MIEVQTGNFTAEFRRMFERIAEEIFIEKKIR